MTPFHHRHPAITNEAVLEECRRELEQRRRFYPARIHQGRMIRAEADREIALCAAWGEDVERIITFESAAALRWQQFRQSEGREGLAITTLCAAIHGLTWNARREALAREIALRARVYPQRVAEARMTRSEADRQIAALEALADRYDDGFDWHASNGIRPQLGLPETTEAIAQATSEWHTHRQAVEARRAPAQQKELL